jgi:hypothetical protein
MEASIMETYRGNSIWQFKVVEKVNDDVSFELVDDVDYGDNTEIIKSPVRPRRSRKERQATKRSLDYHKEMRKGR